jgi:hypothetical protein
VNHHRVDVHEHVTLHRTDEGQAVQADHLYRLAADVSPGRQVGVGLQPAHELSAVERAVEIHVADLDRLDGVDVGVVRRLRRAEVALPGQAEAAGEHLEQLTDEERSLLLSESAEGLRGEDVAGQLPLLELAPELAPELALPEVRSLRGGLRAELGNGGGLAGLVDADEGHVGHQDLAGRQRIGAAARHDGADPHAPLGGVGDGAAEGHVLPDPDRIPELDAVHGGRHHRAPAMPRCG